MTRTMSDRERVAALQRVEADLLWLHLPHRPPCKPCDASGRIGEGDQRKPCPTCDGIGSLRPPDPKATPLVMARQYLLNEELQAARVRAQRPEGATKPTEGSTGWSDPTGQAALSTAALELRANDMMRCWMAGLEVVAESVRFVDETVRTALEQPHGPRKLGAKATVKRIRWLLIAPHHHLTRAVKLLDDETTAQLEHAITLAADAATTVRSGRPSFTGRPMPSVLNVLHVSQQILDTTPPKPAQPERIRCRNHWRFNIDEDCAAHSSQLCSRCIEFRKDWGVMPTEAICRWWRAGRRGVPPGMIAEAKAQGKVKRRTA